MLGIIAGSGLQRLSHLENVRREIVRTPFGETSCALTLGESAGVPVAFINRHGYGHTLAPHQINYRANIWALQKVGVSQICAIGSTGSLSGAIEAGQIIVPHDWIDYTSARLSTYFEGPDHPIVYTDVSQPFDETMRQSLISAAQKIHQTLITQAVYACTNGPRLETPAEVKRMLNDGADVVGMTLIPEAVLAQELGVPYAAMTVCTNRAGGMGTEADEDLMKWRALREQTLSRVEQILFEWIKLQA